LACTGRIATVPRMKRAASTPAQALGAAITMARKQAGLSQTQLGSLIGFDQGNISRIESGAQQVAAGTLFEIATALGTPLHLLIEEAEKRTGDLLSKEAIRVARKWQNAPPHQRAAYSALLGADVSNDFDPGGAAAAN